ncbi:MAG: DUF3256 family protein [Clostridiales bacterium]|jgi:hypothetical protein|nr:DUF3256 family protein [Clostridiales bacterium]
MKRFFVFLIGIFSIFAVSAQDMATFFIQIPDSYLPHLEDAWRKDLVDLYKSDKPAVLENTMTGRSTLQKLTPDYLFLQSTERSTLEIRFLPLITNTFIACVITTVFAPVADSRVAFFTMEWQPLPTSEIWVHADTDSFIKDDIDRNNENYQEARSYLDMDLIHYHLNPDQLTMEAVYTTPDYLSLEECTKVKPFLKETPKVYYWRAGRFE